MRDLTSLKVAAGVVLVGVALGPAGFAKDKTANQEPVAWGMQSGNQGCVIFGETQTVTTENDGSNGFTTHTVKELEVVETQHATLPRKKYDETKEDLDALQALSMQDLLKYVRIPKKYTPEQLEKARAMCGSRPQ
jgi:hypothetical protein